VLLSDGVNQPSLTMPWVIHARCAGRQFGVFSSLRSLTEAFRYAMTNG